MQSFAQTILGQKFVALMVCKLNVTSHCKLSAIKITKVPSSTWFKNTRPFMRNNATCEMLFWQKYPGELSIWFGNVELCVWGWMIQVFAGRDVWGSWYVKVCANLLQLNVSIKVILTLRYKRERGSLLKTIEKDRYIDSIVVFEWQEISLGGMYEAPGTWKMVQTCCSCLGCTLQPQVYSNTK